MSWSILTNMTSRNCVKWFHIECEINLRTASVIKDMELIALRRTVCYCKTPSVVKLGSNSKSNWPPCEWFIILIFLLLIVAFYGCL